MEEQYISVEEAADILKVSTRMVNKYGHEEKIQTRKAGKRILYLRSDVEALAEELGVDMRPAPREPKMDLVPAGEMLEYLRERDNRNEQLQAQLVAAAAEIGALRERLEQQKVLTEDNTALRERIAYLERPWWKRLF